MIIYSIALFFHIVGALGLSVALGLEWTSLRQIHAATLSEQVGAWIRILRGTNKVGFPSMLMMVVTGIYMMAAVWGWMPWLVVTMAALVLVIILTRVTASRLKALESSPAAGTDSLLWFSVQTRVAIVLGITFLKIARPNLNMSLLTIGVAILLGIASVLPIFRRHAQAL
jgi:hypothetical protein